ncbi:MAG: hypothetical protein NVS2B14_19280 [Chamaesiphon sp.]
MYIAKVEGFMNQVISWIQQIRLRQTITVLLIGLAFFVSTAFDIHGNSLQAQAQVSKAAVPDGQVRMKTERIEENAEKSAELLADEGRQVRNRAAESAQDTGKNLIDTVREKLNLDEPIDPGTKAAAEQLKETITGRD